MAIPGRTQFSIRTLGLFTIGAAALLTCLANARSNQFPLAALLWLAALSLAAILDGRLTRGAGRTSPVVTGVWSGALAGLVYGVVSMLATRAGWQAWLPGSDLAFHAYWWVATGALVGGLVGCLAGERRPQLAVEQPVFAGAIPAAAVPAAAPAVAVTPTAARPTPNALWRHAGCWLTSAHLHVCGATLLSVATAGLGGHTLAGGSYTSAAHGWQPSITWDSSGDLEDGCLLLTMPATGERPLEGGEQIVEICTVAKPVVRSASVSTTTRRSGLVDSFEGQPRARESAVGPTAGQGGPTGLEILLSPDKSTVKVGETVKFTITLRNTLDQPLNVYVGHSLSGNSIQNGSSFIVRDARGGLPPRWAPSFPGCGTGAGPIYVSLAPGASFSYETPAQWGPTAPWVGFRQPTAPPASKPEEAYAFPRVYFPTGGSDVHRFRVVHHVVESQHENHQWTVRHGSFDPQARLWVGQAVSNEVTLTVVRK